MENTRRSKRHFAVRSLLIYRAPTLQWDRKAPHTPLTPRKAVEYNLKNRKSGGIAYEKVFPGPGAAAEIHRSSRLLSQWPLSS